MGKTYKGACYLPADLVEYQHRFEDRLQSLSYLCPLLVPPAKIGEFPSSFDEVDEGIVDALPMADALLEILLTDAQVFSCIWIA